MPGFWCHFPEELANSYQDKTRRASRRREALAQPAAADTADVLQQQQQDREDREQLRKLQGQWQSMQPPIAEDAVIGQPPGTRSRAQVSATLGQHLPRHYVVVRPFRGDASSGNSSSGSGAVHSINRVTASAIKEAPKAVRAFLACSKELRRGPAGGQLGKAEATAVAMLLYAGLQPDAPDGLQAFSDVVINHFCDQLEEGMMVNFFLTHGCVSTNHSFRTKAEAMA